MFRISSAAKLCGVCTKTLRRWEKRGYINPNRTPGGHRRYSMKDLMDAKLVKLGSENSDNASNMTENEKYTIIYSRVSSHKQKKRGDLDRQQERLEKYCNKIGVRKFFKINDVGSGLNTKRNGLKKLFKLVSSGSIEKIVITFKDRLTRFGFEYIRKYCELFNVSIVPIERKESISVQEELVNDMMSLIASFSGRLYGMRSKKSKKRKKIEQKKTNRA